MAAQKEWLLELLFYAMILQKYPRIRTLLAGVILTLKHRCRDLSPSHKVTQLMTLNAFTAIEHLHVAEIIMRRHIAKTLS